jgi:hypothetical protein|nr:DUF3570 domain-containing protein [Kofleriaceae bacterium]
MRLQLIALALVACAAARAHADTTFAAKTQVYADSDHTTVVSPAVEASADVAPTTNVSLGYLVDIVSSASVDVVTQASKEMHDQRHQVSTGLAQIFGALTISGSYSFSRENDYLSHTFGVTATRDFDDKNTTLSLGYGASLNTVGRANDDNFSRSLTVQHVAATWTQVFSPATIGQLTYELEYADGYQASPYRFVPVRLSVDAAPEFWVPETDPETRYRHSFVVGVNHALGDDSVQADYRFYTDTWGITSHTVGARYFKKLGKKAELRLRERFYTQGAATFYENVYTQAEQFMAYDRELSPLWSETVGAKLTYRLAPHVEGELKCDVFYYSYSDFAPLASRTGTNTGIGVSLLY